VELNPFKQVRSASWRVLHATRTAGLAQKTLECFVPSEHVKTLLRGEEERLRQTDETILRGVGELAILVHRGKRNLDDLALDSVWQAVRAGEAGVALGDVFDPHQAQFLRSITPALAETAGPEAELPPAIIADEI